MNLTTQNFWIRTGNCLKQLGKTQLELCQYCDINYQTYRGWIVHGTYPNALQVSKMAQFLNTSVEYLVTGRESDTYRLKYESLIASMKEVIERSLSH